MNRKFWMLAVTMIALIYWAGQAGAQILAGHTPRQVLDGTATRISHYNPEQKLRLVLAIQPPHMTEEEQFLKELQTKGSPNFHKFLTPEEWNARYAPSAEDEQKVVDWAVSQGFTVTNRYNHRLIVDVEAPAGVIENVFGVTINNYQFKNEVDFANDSDPILPTNISGIVYSVQGLNNIQRMHGSRPGSGTVKGPDYIPGLLVAEAGSDHGDGNPAKASSNQAAINGTVSNLTGGFMDPSDIYSSQTYNYGGLQALSHCCNVHNDSTGSPKETSIAIAGFGNFLGSDISGFMNAYGLSWNWTSYNIAGTPGCDTSSETPPCATGETTEDIEWSIATSNNPSSSNLTSHVYIYLGGNFANSTFTTMYSKILSDNKTRVLTTSWSCTEIYDCDKPTMDSRHTIFNNMVGVGFTLIAASGDRGASDDCQNNIPSSGPKVDPSAHTSVAYPASDYDFVAAGGTQLMLYSNGTWDYENAWQGGFGAGSCNGNGGGSGGGISAYYAQPSWQSSLSSLGSMRLSPDLSLNALGIGQNLYINGVMNGDANGTSVVAPELAGFFAQENTYLNYIGHICGPTGTSSCVPVGNPNPLMYDDAISGAQHNPFYNMLSGCNSNDATQQDSLSYFCAGPGYSFDISGTGNQYNLVSGWGSANMMQLAWGINWELIPANGNPTIAFTGPVINTWYNTNQTVYWTLSDAGSSGLPAPGVAGFTQGWDSIPADPYSEPHGGSGNSFYSGPQFPFGTTGCLAFSNNGCGGNGGAQGCHTVHVRGWDNQGVTTGDQTYGPLCYDTVAPTIAINSNPSVPASGWFNTIPTITLSATDPGGSNASGVARIYGVVGPTSCLPTNLGACQTYGPPFTIGQGIQTVTTFSEDNTGNFSGVDVQTFKVDVTAPVTTLGLSGTLVGRNYLSAVTVVLPSSDNLSGVQATYYSLDGGATTPYVSAFLISTGGSHTLNYWSVDVAGNTETANSNTFTIVSPSALLSPTPGSILESSPVAFTWSTGSGVTRYQLCVGDLYAGNCNLYASGVTTALSANVTGVPVNGEKLYVRLYSLIGTTWLCTDYTYIMSGTPVLAQLNSPAPGTALTGSSATFQWSPGGGVTGYILQLGTTGAGSHDLYSGVSTQATSASVTGLPISGATIYARLFSQFNTSWANYIDYTYTGAGAALLTPTPGSIITTSSVAFTWSPGTGVTEYTLAVGDLYKGTNNLYNSGGLRKTTSVNVTGLPVNGEKLYVRLCSYSSTWQCSDYNYIMSGTPVLAALTSPTPVTQLPGSSVPFQWSAGSGITSYILDLGTNGKGSHDLYTGVSTAATSATVTGLPTNGVTVYARLFSHFNGSWAQYLDTTYTEYGTPQPAALLTPTGTTLTTSSVGFTWSAGGGVTSYQLCVGDLYAGNCNLYASGATSAHSANATGLPVNGEKIYARLFSLINSVWQYTDYNYIMSGTPVLAALTSPAPGSTLAGSSATFQWSKGGGVTSYMLTLGTTGAGSRNLYNGASTTATSASVTGLPTTGGTIYARLYSQFNGSWTQYIDYTYTAQ